MKILSTVAVCVLTGGLVGCSSLDSPLATLNPFRTGRDARVFNAQTGQWEWPEQVEARRRAEAANANQQPRRTDGRYFDAAKNEWVDAPADDVSSNRPKEKASAPPSAAPNHSIVTNASSPEPAPPPPPTRASGVYNPSTGRFDWDTSGAPPPPTPAPQKGWKLWPF